MNGDRPRAVFDAVVFVQALISGRGPAAACIDRIRSGDAVLFLSDPIVAEMRDVPLRPELIRRYAHLTKARVEAFVADVVAVSVHAGNVPRVFALPRDPKDEPYTDLAIAVDASYLVTWNERHLTYLMKRDTPEGREFCDRFPHITILTPVAFLEQVGAAGHP